MTMDASGNDDTVSERPRRAPSAAEARAAVEAQRGARRAERDAAFAEAYAQGVPGRAIVATSWLSTAVFAGVSLAAVLDGDLVPVAAMVSIVWFLLGCAAFAWVLVLAALRSRDDLMGIGGLFFLAGSAPRPIQAHLLGSLGIAVLASIVAAALRPFTELAFGTLAPTLALALCGWWSVRHGLFPARTS